MFKNRVIYIITVLFALQYAVLYNVYDTSVVLFLVAALPIVSGVCLIINYYNIDVKMIPPLGVSAKNKEIPVTFELHNRFYFPIKKVSIVIDYNQGFEENLPPKSVLLLHTIADNALLNLNSNGYGNKYKKKFLLWLHHRTDAESYFKGARKVIHTSLDAKGMTRITTGFYSEYSGNIRIRIRKIRILGYLGLGSICKAMNYQINVVVLPDIYTIEQPVYIRQRMGAGTSEVYSLVKSGDDPSEVFDIREYHDGDKLQRIHWKLSSKRGIYMVKEYSLPMDTNAMLMVEMTTDSVVGGKLSIYSAIIETTLSISHAFINSNYIHCIAYYHKKSGEMRKIKIETEDDIYTAMEVLVHLTSYEGAKVLEAAADLEPHKQYPYYAYISGCSNAVFLHEFALRLLYSSLDFIYVCDGGKEECKKSMEAESIHTTVIDMQHLQESLQVFEVG